MSYDNDEVGIFNPYPNIITASQLNLNTIRITTADSPYQLTSSVVVIADTSGGAIVINLSTVDDYEHPTYYIKCVGAFPITINPPAGELINDAPAIVVSADNLYDVIQIVRDTSGLIANWAIISTIIPAPAVPPTTTKGDIRTHNNTAETRLPVGADNQMLVANSATSTGLAWVNQPTPPTTTKGDIRTRDATVETRLPVGVDNQMLVANSATPTGLAWVNQPTPPTTTKGDIRTHNNVSETRLPVGVDNQMLVANSATSTGLAWVNQPTPAVPPTTTKGDIRTRDAITETRLPVGANNQMLVANSATSTGLAWANQQPIVRTHTLVSIVLNLSSASWTVLARFSWLQSSNSAITNMMLIYYINFISGRTAQIRVVNLTTNTVLGTGAVIGADGIYTIALSPIPTANALIELQGLYAGAGTSPQLYSAHLEFSS